MNGLMRQKGLEEALTRRGGAPTAPPASKAPSMLLDLLSSARRSSSGLPAPYPPPPQQHQRPVPTTPAPPPPPPARVSTGDWNQPSPVPQPNTAAGAPYRGGFAPASAHYTARPQAPSQRRVVDFGAAPDSAPPKRPTGGQAEPRLDSSAAGASAADCVVVLDSTAVPNKLLVTGKTYGVRDVIQSAVFSAGFAMPQFVKPLDGWLVDAGAEAVLVSSLREAGATVVDAGVAKAVTEASLAAVEARSMAAKAAAAVSNAPPPPPPPRPSPPPPPPPAAAPQPHKVNAPAAKAHVPAPAPPPPPAPAQRAGKWVTDEALRACVLSIMAGSALDTVTPRQVREAAAAQLGCDLTEHKKRITQLTQDLFEEATRLQQEATRRKAQKQRKGRKRQRLVLDDDYGWDSPPPPARRVQKQSPPPVVEEEVIDLCDSEDDAQPRIAAAAPRVAPPAAAVPHLTASGRAGDPIVDALRGMGFDKAEAEAGALATGHASVEAALDWLYAAPPAAPPAAHSLVAADASAAAAAAADAAAKAQAAAERLQVLQKDKERARQDGARLTSEKAARAAAAPQARKLQPRGGGGGAWGGGELVYAGDVISSRSRMGWEGMGSVNMGGMDDFFSL